VTVPAYSRRVGAALTLATLAACAAAASPGAPASPAPACRGQEYLEVRNDLSRSVDVYGYVGNTRTYLATVSAGVTRVPLLQPTRSFYAARDGVRVSGRRTARRVSFARICERA
jgi:hypothetical protein